ncbi:hypothetical protein BDF14DRAFT_1744374 [Spinellus fusiger]|nr:hypothetical protein BDF14DRAFT_1744374 [Spinellus fusiger]
MPGSSQKRSADEVDMARHAPEPRRKPRVVPASAPTTDDSSFSEQDLQPTTAGLYLPPRIKDSSGSSESVSASQVFMNFRTPEPTEQVLIDLTLDDTDEEIFHSSTSSPYSSETVHDKAVLTCGLILEEQETKKESVEADSETALLQNTSVLSDYIASALERKMNPSIEPTVKPPSVVSFESSQRSIEDFLTLVKPPTDTYKQQQQQPILSFPPELSTTRDTTLQHTTTHHTKDISVPIERRSVSHPSFLPTEASLSSLGTAHKETAGKPPCDVSTLPSDKDNVSSIYNTPSSTATLGIDSSSDQQQQGQWQIPTVKYKRLLILY